MPKLTVSLSEQELNIAEYAVIKLIQRYEQTVESAEAPRAAMVQAIADLKTAQKALRNAR